MYLLVESSRTFSTLILLLEFCIHRVNVIQPLLIMRLLPRVKLHLGLNRKKFRNCFKGRVQRFSQQVVMNKCFLINSKNNFGADLCCRFREKQKPLNSDTFQFRQNDVTVPKARL